MPESAEAKLDRYKQRIEELQRKAKAESKKIREKERKRRSTMLVAYGLLVLEEIKNGERTESEVKAKLDGILTQNSHRAAVGLPLRPGKQKEEKTTTPPKASSKKTDSKSSVSSGQKVPLPETEEDSLANEFA